ncbi:hypothetical protein M011DRAFT_217021 [Sporormia fimetaria CBS 119925]|uniref:C-CAP/cofactor C-like domain-containing protein n=1 Tax=Sporormia fimetaria CBS 119925 TaxID=1340428 RepID=A0A6A6V3D9_9PLEO|nr:hypothetical protein M011DRAFT_217021 [Sporormia fimetaria CBS 119925]
MDSRLTEADLKETFYRNFQQQVASVRQQINDISRNTGAERTMCLENCLTAIDRLSHDVKDASGYLPAYDRRAYSQTIKALSEELQVKRSESGPVKKFQFKNRAKKPLDFKPSESSSPNPLPTPSSTPTPQPTTLLTHTSNNLITFLPSTTHSSGTISYISHSLLALSTSPPILSLTLLHITSTLLLTPPIQGPLHLTSLTNTVLLTSCRQFRMHDCKNVTVYLHCASRPIIEDCDGIAFAPLPSGLIDDESKGVENRWDQIDDFKWLKAEPSPHFRVLAPGERVPDSVLMDAITSATEDSLEDRLRAAGVPLLSNDHEEV